MSKLIINRDRVAFIIFKLLIAIVIISVIDYLGISKPFFPRRVSWFFTTWSPLSKDSGFRIKTTIDYAKNKFGRKYRHYLTGLDRTNKSWWNKRFAELQKDTNVSDKFKSKVSGWSDSDSDSKFLSNTCNEVYKSEISKITTNGSGNGEYKEADVWKYCSGFGTKPNYLK